VSDITWTLGVRMRPRDEMPKNLGPSIAHLYLALRQIRGNSIGI